MSVLVALGAAVAAVRADAEVVTITWDAAQKFEKTLSVAPGKFEEVCGALRPSQQVGWAFESSAAVDFNVHYHEGKDVRYPARSEAVRVAADTLVVDSAQDYCWMWSNKTTLAATVRLQLWWK